LNLAQSANHVKVRGDCESGIKITEFFKNITSDEYALVRWKPSARESVSMFN